MMNKELLEESILKIAKQAGLETTGTFHLTAMSRGSSAIFIMEVMRLVRKRLCEEVKRVVTGFPSDTESGCIVLLPEVADEIIRAAQADRPGGLPASFGRHSGG
jgi:hypothetical protein